jgi:hypothetical protein
MASVPSSRKTEFLGPLPGYFEALLELKLRSLLSTGRAKVSADAVAAIRSALEAAGVTFVDENGEGPGVRLNKRKGRK